MACSEWRADRRGFPSTGSFELAVVSRRRSTIFVQPQSLKIRVLVVNPASRHS
jgi:hypothetical protein